MSAVNTTELMPNGKDLLLSFLNNGEEWPSYFSREWLYAPELKVYVRKGRRYILGRRLKTLEIATIEVYERGRGTFTDFFRYAVSVCPYPCFMVESVQTARFCDFFRRQGMLEIPDSFPPSFYLLKQKSSLHFRPQDYNCA